MSVCRVEALKCLPVHRYCVVIFVLLAAANKTYIGSVLFRTSAYTGAK